MIRSTRRRSYHLTTCPVNPHNDLDAFGVPSYSPASPEDCRGFACPDPHTRHTHSHRGDYAEPFGTTPVSASPGRTPRQAKRVPAGSRGRLASVPFRSGGKARGWQLPPFLILGHTGQNGNNEKPLRPLGLRIRKRPKPGTTPATGATSLRPRFRAPTQDPPLLARAPLRRGTGKRP